MADQLPVIAGFAARGMAVLAFDHRGSGASDRFGRQPPSLVYPEYLEDGNSALEDLRGASKEGARRVEEHQIQQAIQPLTPPEDEPIDLALAQLHGVPWFDTAALKELRQEDLANLQLIKAGKLLEEQLHPLTKIAQRAERRLPAPWKNGVGLNDPFGPCWPVLHEKAGTPVEHEAGHFIRAPQEFGKPAADGLRSRMVELRIDDLAGLLEVCGGAIEFWMITDEVGGEPRWVLPMAVCS
jgi:hypothetical protein